MLDAIYSLFKAAPIAAAFGTVAIGIIIGGTLLTGLYELGRTLGFWRDDRDE